MQSEGNNAVGPNELKSIKQPAISGVKRKRGRPRKYEHTINELPQMVQPIQSVPPLRTALDGSNIRYDGLHINHTSGGSVNPKMHIHHLSSAHQTQGDKSSRPRDSVNLLKAYENPASNYSNAHVQGNSGKDIAVGKHFIGKMTKKCPGFSLITVKVNDNQVLKGWVLDENNLRPIAPKDDLAPDLPTLRPSQVRKRASAIHTQGPPTLPVHLEGVTLAKPLQMRRPVEKSVAMHTVPSTPRPYIGSGVVAETPLSVTSGNAESRPLPKQEIESASTEPSAADVAIKSSQPVLVSHEQVANQDVLVEGKSVTEVHKESESSNGSQGSSVKAEKLSALVDTVASESPGEKELLNVPVMNAVEESSAQIQHVDPAVMDEIEAASGPREQANNVDSKQHILKETPDNKEQSGHPKTGEDLKGGDISKSHVSDDVKSVHNEHQMEFGSN